MRDGERGEREKEEGGGRKEKGEERGKRGGIPSFPSQQIQRITFYRAPARRDCGRRLKGNELSKRHIFG